MIEICITSTAYKASRWRYGNERELLVKVYITLVIILLLNAISTFAAAAVFMGMKQSIQLADFGGAPHEAFLDISYSVECSSDLPYRGITGAVLVNNRTIRLDLHASKNRVLTTLGRVSSQHDHVSLVLDPSSNCRLADLTTNVGSTERGERSFDGIRELALLHSPFLAVRPDQLENRYTDLPLAIVYSTLPRGNGLHEGFFLRYTMIFSDEDSKTSIRGTDGQMARYGRRTDIEWIYEVEFDGYQQVIGRRYQGNIFGGIKDITDIHDFTHSTKSFHGSYLDGNSMHPILYNVADNNVFSDEQPSQLRGNPLTGYHLMPECKIPFPLAREALMFMEPWMFKVSDLENARENKISAPASDYLFVLIDGVLDGSFTAAVTLHTGERVLSGNGHSDVDRLGEDLWSRQAFTAIPVGAALLDEIEAGHLDTSSHGDVRLQDTSWAPGKLQIETLRLFRLLKTGDTYRTQELTSRFKCSLNGLKSVCFF